jgi:hypothetical protein
MVVKWFGYMADSSGEPTVEPDRRHREGSHFSTSRTALNQMKMHACGENSTELVCSGWIVICIMTVYAILSHHAARASIQKPYDTPVVNIF